jgi:hypothetical protein
MLIRINMMVKRLRCYSFAQRMHQFWSVNSDELGEKGGQCNFYCSSVHYGGRNVLSGWGGWSVFDTLLERKEGGLGVVILL